MKSNLSIFLPSAKLTLTMVSLALSAACARAPSESAAPHSDSDESASLVSEEELTARGCKFVFVPGNTIQCERVEGLHAQYEQLASVSRYSANAETHFNDKKLNDETRVSLGLKYLGTRLFLDRQHLVDSLRSWSFSSQPQTFESLQEEFYLHLRRLAAGPRVVVEFDSLAPMRGRVNKADVVAVRILDKNGIKNASDIPKRMREAIADYQALGDTTHAAELDRMIEAVEQLSASIDGAPKNR